MMSLDCPQCGRADQVRKVSAIIDAESVQGTYSAIPSARTNLATKLLHMAPGEEPQIPRWKISSIFWLGIAGLLILASAAWLVILFYYEIVDEEISPSAYITLGVIFLIGIGIGWLAMPDAGPEAKARARRKHADWEQQVMDWRQTYYCGRCDTTFVLRR